MSAPFDWLAQGMGNAAGWMFESVWKVFDSTTMVDVTSSQYTKVYNILFGVAVFVTYPVAPHDCRIDFADPFVA